MFKRASKVKAFVLCCSDMKLKKALAIIFGPRDSTESYF